MKPHINNFKIVFSVLLCFFAFNSYSQEVSSISENLEVSIIENQEKVLNENNTSNKQINISKKTVSPKKEILISKNKRTPILLMAIKELNNKLETVVFENKMLTMRSNALISSIDRD